ncbi:MAG: TetR/AcrR family transcriptional regulator [Chloroflexi bacterium]|nr:TetR/AcrR family transcriptional regulator [Chloroflexota bacterium]MCI0581248.1 TetR/AcrR family transcriptional regulator [Chloroflexota bacterium]MCI0648655.1 TetR/AcrR family transcriptional regulator [Chloroflexota bacterium]MCI0728063.1 TetR/AcrR family transcriptional regulator [Chloroflexota bacterium]
MPRKYQLKRRAERQEETRQRIIDAAIQLHQTAGGAATISAIAKLAGVERLTLYRHFPDEQTLLRACTGHYLACNPPPDPAAWQEVEDAEEHLRIGLRAVYAYHRRTEPMFVQATRELEVNPVLGEVLAPYFAYWAHLAEVLAEVWQPQEAARSLVHAAIGHALSFTTWRSLVRDQGLDDAAVIELMVAMVRCLGC